MQRQCVACGADFEAKRSTAKYCSSSCRANVATGRVVVLKPPATEPTGEAGVQESATRKVLAEADREDSPMGVAAILLSRDIDSEATPVNMRTSAIKQLEVTLAAALKGSRAGSSVDELRQQRAARRAG